MSSPAECVAADVSRIRVLRGISVATLAKDVNVSRQTIYAIEAGDYVPNTSVALKLARALGVSVEELFRLPGQANPASSKARCLPDCAPPATGEPVQLCRVANELIAAPSTTDSWYLPSSDAIVTSRRSGGQANVQPYSDGGVTQKRVLIAGCDPAVSLVAKHLRRSGIELVFIQRNSSQALRLLREDCVHIAGTHLHDDRTGEANRAEIDRTFALNSVALVSFAVWEAGILTAPSNPKQIAEIADLARRNVVMVNREKGAGSRRLLDARLKTLGLNSGKIRGYNSLASGHLSAARAVAEGRADCCIATRAAARVFGLGFIPMVAERYDLAIRRKHLKLPAIAALLDMLNTAAFRRELEGVAGYETKVSGQRVM